MSSQTVATDKFEIVKWGTAIVVPGLVYLCASLAGLPQPHVLFYTITCVALVMWALNLMSDTFVAISLPIFYIVFGVAKPGQILRPWSSSVGWIMLGGLVFAHIMMCTGLARRLAIWALYVTRGSFKRLLWGILLAGFIIAPCIPSAMGKAALITVICVGICEALNLEKRGKAASAIMLTGFISIATSKLAFLTGGADISMYVGLLADKVGIPISWGEYFLHNFPLALIYAPITLLVLFFVLRPKLAEDSTAYVAESHAKLGPMSLDEKKAAGLIIALILFLITDRYHGINAGWIMIILSFISFLPGIKLMDEKKVQKLPLNAVFFVVGCMTIGAGAMAIGADKNLASAIAPMMKGSGEMTAMLLSYMSGVILNLLFTPLAAFSAMTVPMTELAMEMGLNPLPILYAFSYGLDQYIFPYEYAILLYFYATGWINLKYLITIFGIRFFVAGIFLAVLAKPWWTLLGLFEPLIK